MSRCLTLEEYLQEFVDQNTEQSVEDLKLLVTNQQAQELGFFLIQGLAGFVECARLKRPQMADEALREEQNETESETDELEEFIN